MLFLWIVLSRLVKILLFNILLCHSLIHLFRRVFKRLKWKWHLQFCPLRKQLKVLKESLFLNNFKIDPCDMLSYFFCRVHLRNFAHLVAPKTWSLLCTPWAKQRRPSTLPSWITCRPWCTHLVTSKSIRSLYRNYCQFVPGRLFELTIIPCDLDKKETANNVS